MVKPTFTDYVKLLYTLSAILHLDFCIERRSGKLASQ